MNTELKLFSNNTLSMTLKEITDLLEVEHYKAMFKVKKMLESESFGTVSKIDTVYNDRGQTIETYVLDRRQSIAVAAKLNTDLLFRVIDRWQELEEKNIPIKPLTELELAKKYVEALEYIEESKPKIEAFDNAKAIFSNKEYSEGEKAYKKDIKIMYPFLGDGKINNILEYYTTKKYKDSVYYIKDEIEECMKKFFRDCKYRISDSRISVIANHECLLNSKCVISKEYAIEYLNFLEEEFDL